MNGVKQTFSAAQKDPSSIEHVCRITSGSCSQCSQQVFHSNGWNDQHFPAQTTPSWFSKDCDITKILEKQNNKPEWVKWGKCQRGNDSAVRGWRQVFMKRNTSQPVMENGPWLCCCTCVQTAMLKSWMFSVARCAYSQVHVRRCEAMGHAALGLHGLLPED